MNQLVVLSIPKPRDVAALADEVRDIRADLERERTYGHAVRLQRAVRAMNNKAEVVRSTFAVVRS